MLFLSDSINTDIQYVIVLGSHLNSELVDCILDVFYLLYFNCWVFLLLLRLQKQNELKIERLTVSLQGQPLLLTM